MPLTNQKNKLKSTIAFAGLALILGGCGGSSGQTGSGSASSRAYLLENLGTLVPVSISGSGSFTTTNSIVGSATSPVSISSVIFSPDGKYMYTVDTTNESIDQFALASNGSVTEVTTTPFSLGATEGLVISPNGQYLYLTNDNISATAASTEQFSIGTDGKLAPLNSAILTSGTLPFNGLYHPGTFTPNGTMFVGTLNNIVSLYTVNSSGNTTFVSSLALPGQAGKVAISPDGNYIFVVSQGVGAGNGLAPGNIYGIQIGTGNILAQVSSATLTGAEITDLEIDSKYDTLYAVENDTSQIAQFQIGANGSLTSLSTAVVGTDSSPTSISLNQSQAYVICGTQTIEQFNLGSNGGLVNGTNLNSSQFGPVGGSESSIQGIFFPGS